MTDHINSKDLHAPHTLEQRGRNKGDFYVISSFNYNSVNSTSKHIYKKKYPKTMDGSVELVANQNTTPHLNDNSTLYGK